MILETNLFRIQNLKALSSSYLLFEIIGLKDMDEDYDTNVQYIIRSLSYLLKHPATVIFKNKKPFLVIRNEKPVLDVLPLEYPVRGDNVVYFKKWGQPLELDFENYTEETKGIILRFLQFDVSTKLNEKSSLWQPKAGDAFFNRMSSRGNDKVSVFDGFDIRVAEVPGGGIGIAVDVTNTYVESPPLDVHLTRADFRKLRINKGHLIYDYGNKRYEIKAAEYSDLNITQSKFTRKSDGETVTLLQDIRDKYGPTMPPEVAQLPDDAAVLLYETNDGEERKAVAGLCHRVLDTEDPLVHKLHRDSILAPHHRRRAIHSFHQQYLSNLRFGTIPLKISSVPVIVEKRKLIAPDICFGQDVVLSVRGTEGAIQTTINKLGGQRKELLNRDKAGFYTNAEFEVQYLLVPYTFYHMYANEQYFLKDLAYYVNKMHVSETGWKPKPIVYDDRNKKKVSEIGFAIIQALEENVPKRSGGYAVVMLPSGVKKEKRQHDELAALVVSQLLDEWYITASIMHTDILEYCYEFNRKSPVASYFVRPEAKPLYSGYVRGVALNQVLLNNERWPFVLKTPLHADLTIGIDVKGHIAGFTFIDKFSRNITPKYHESTNQERLSKAQVVTMLTKYITLQAKYAKYPIKNIVIHRDGKLYTPEKEGAFEALRILITKGVLPSDVTISFAEIPKNSIVSLRIFNKLQEMNGSRYHQTNPTIVNPETGIWVPVNGHEAFLCTTGVEYKQHKGSSRPLHVKATLQGLTLEQVIEDVYFLSCLAYTKLDDCSRYPLTIKITDRRINILGSEFDMDALEILKSEYL